MTNAELYISGYEDSDSETTISFWRYLDCTPYYWYNAETDTMEFRRYSTETVNVNQTL